RLRRRGIAAPAPGGNRPAAARSRPARPSSRPPSAPARRRRAGPPSRVASAGTPPVSCAATGHGDGPRPARSCRGRRRGGGPAGCARQRRAPAGSRSAAPRTLPCPTTARRSPRCAPAPSPARPTRLRPPATGLGPRQLRQTPGSSRNCRGRPWPDRHQHPPGPAEMTAVVETWPMSDRPATTRRARSFPAAAAIFSETGAVLRRLVAGEVGPTRLRPPADSNIASLVRAIVYQQLAGAAASAIHGRLIDALGGGVSAEGILSLPTEKLRAVGLSANKTASLQDLASKV